MASGSVGTATIVASAVGRRPRRCVRRHVRRQLPAVRTRVQAAGHRVQLRRHDRSRQSREGDAQEHAAGVGRNAEQSAAEGDRHRERRRQSRMRPARCSPSTTRS